MGVLLALLPGMGLPAAAQLADGPMAGEQAPRLDQLAAPAFVREHFTVEDGLPVNVINELAQTPDGYLWISTNDGLARFDGIGFTIYRTGEVEAFTSNRIGRMMVDAKGTLWICTAGGRFLHYRDGVFTHVDRLDGRDGIRVTHVQADPDGNAWVLVDNKLARATDPHNLVSASIGEINRDIHTFSWEADGTLWLGAETGLYHIEPDGRISQRTKRPVNRLRRGSDGVLVASHITPDGILFSRFAEVGPGTIWRRPGLAFPSFDTQWTIDSDGANWAIVQDTRLEREGQTVVQTASAISSVLHDQRGNTWVATVADGLYRVRPSPMRVLGAPEGVFTDNLYSVHQTRSGAVWLGGYDNGLTRLEGNRATTIQPPTLHALALYEDRSGALWIGGRGLCRIERPDLESRCTADGLPEELTPGPKPNTHNVLALHEDGAGRLWVGAMGGLFSRPADCQSTDCWILRHTDPFATIRVFHEQDDGTLWMGTSSTGLLRYQHGRFDTLSTARGFPADAVRAIHEDNEGVLWIGTETAGLVRLDPRATADLSAMPKTVYQKADGLFDDGIHRILPDDEGRLWMNTNRGIFWVEHAALEAFHRGEISQVHSVGYTEQNGMRNREGNGGMHPAGMRDARGRFWFPTQDGVVVFDPRELSPDPAPVQAIIEEVRTENRTWRPTERAIALSALMRDFEIQYTAPNFIDPEGLRFAYRLDGQNEDWVEAGTRRTAFYTNVAPGTYTFRVRAQNDHGDWSEASEPLVLSVAPFFYETGWFRVLLLLVLATGLAGIYQLRVRQLKRREVELGEIVEERTRELRAEKRKTEQQAAQLLELDAAKNHFFANISHEFRTPLTLINGPLEDLMEGEYGPLRADAQEQIAVAVDNSHRLLHLVNQLLDLARLEAGRLTLKVSVVDAAAYVHHIAHRFAAMAARKNIDFQIAVPDAPAVVHLDAEQIEKVIGNLLGNAFKFTPDGGTIAISVSTQDDTEHAGWLVVTVRDTGPGIAPEHRTHLFERFYQADASSTRRQSGTGIGLALVHELVMLHRGKIEVESELGRGTTFTLRLRLGEAHFLAAEDAAVASEPFEHGALPLSALAGEIVVPQGATPETGGDGQEVVSPEGEDVTTVLVVEDNAQVRAYVRRQLTRRYRVLEAADGQEALALALDAIPDLIVSDVMMPRMDGFALCHAVKTHPDLDFIPVVLLTSKASQENKITGLERGADAYMTKPFNVRELEVRVDKLIESRRTLKARYSEAAAPFAITPVVAEVTSADKAYLEEVRAVISEHLSDEGFGVRELASALGQSRASLYRRFKALLDQSPTELIWHMRLVEASYRLTSEAGTVNEVAYSVGFKSVSHFCKRFKEQFGESPRVFASKGSNSGQ